MEKATSGGVGFLSLLFLLFLGLKLGNVIDWSWWWVFAPLWIPVALVVVFIGIAFLVMIITTPRPKQEKKGKK